MGVGGVGGGVCFIRAKYRGINFELHEITNLNHFSLFQFTVNDLFSAQRTEERLFLFNIWWKKKSPFSAPIMKHFLG